MRKLKALSLLALLLVGVFAFNRMAFGWSSTGGDGSEFTTLQETAVFFNNAGATLTAGQVVAIDLNGTGVTANDTLGAYVETVSGADSVLVVGVVKSTSAPDQTPVVVVTKGVIDVRCDDLSDAVTSGAAVGTSGRQQGLCGGGTNLGIALEAGAGTDGDLLNVWIDCTGAD